MARPERIEVIRRGPLARILIDGQELGIDVARDGVRVDVDPDGMPSVHLRLLADHVLVDDRAYERTEPKGDPS